MNILNLDLSLWKWHLVVWKVIQPPRHSQGSYKLSNLERNNQGKILKDEQEKGLEAQEEVRHSSITHTTIIALGVCYQDG